MPYRSIVLAALIGLSGCSSIIEGTSQQIAVNTNPAGAECGLYREGTRIATIENAPGSALINKTKHDLWVVCVKQGYHTAAYFDHSGAAAATFGNILVGGGIGWAIDSASGADNKYDSPVTLTLTPDIAGASPPVPALPPTFTGPSTKS